MTFQIEHDAAASRFIISKDGQLAELVYSLRDGKLVIEHTGVPEAIGGQGIAGALSRGDQDGAARLHSALVTMQRYQGQVTGVDISA